MNIETKRILIGCPISKEKDYCITDWIDHIMEMISNSKHRIGLVLAENGVSTSDRSIAEKHILKRYPNFKDAAFIFTPTLKHQDVRLAIARSWNSIVFECQSPDWFFDNRPIDFHLSIECDVFPPVDSIDRLVEHHEIQMKNQPLDEPICVGYPYMVYLGERSRPLYQTANFNSGSIEVLTLPAFPSFMFTDGQLKPITGIGQGCILIPCSIYTDLEIRFRWETGSIYFPDAFFFIDLAANGVPVLVDTSVICEHRNQDWSAVQNNFTV